MFTTINEKVKFIEAPPEAHTACSNSVFIEDDVRVLIDSSCGNENIDYLLNQGIDVIVNSHFHEDHILNNHRFTGAEIWAHPKDAPAIRSLDIFSDWCGFSAFNEDNMWQYYLDLIQLHPSPVHRTFRDGELLDFGTTKLKVIHTPGHTPGHCCFLMDDSILISADIDLRAFGPWYGTLCSNIDDFIASIKLCIDINPSMLITAHNGIITEDIQVKLWKYLDVIYQREDKLLKSLQRPSTLQELTDQFIFYGPIKRKVELRRVFEKIAIYLHLQRLLADGRIVQNGNRYYLK